MTDVQSCPEVCQPSKLLIEEVTDAIVFDITSHSLSFDSHWLRKGHRVCTFARGSALVGGFERKELLVQTGKQLKNSSNTHTRTHDAILFNFR